MLSPRTFGKASRIWPSLPVAQTRELSSLLEQLVFLVHVHPISRPRHRCLRLLHCPVAQCMDVFQKNMESSVSQNRGEQNTLDWQTALNSLVQHCAAVHFLT
jgi:hypothetical protein